MAADVVHGTIRQTLDTEENLAQKNISFWFQPFPSLNRVYGDALQ